MFRTNADRYLVLALSLTASMVMANEKEIPTLPDQIDIPEEYLAAAKRAKNQAMNSEVMRSRVSDVMEEVKSEQWQARKNEFLSLLRADAGLDPVESDDPDSEGPSSRPLLFISSSMPEITLRNYARDLEKVGGVMVMRGMIGGLERTQPTMEFIAKVLRRNPACEGPQCVMRSLDVVVDPIQFKNHGITKVPALVVEPDFDFQSYCEKGATPPGMGVPVVYGDASLRSLLERLTMMDGGTPAKPLLAQLENQNAQ